MPKKIEPKSAMQVARLSGRGLHAVGGVAGLHLQVAKGGSRSWILRTTVGSKRRDIGLGGYPDVPLALARDKARTLREKIGDGIDPIAEREEARQALIAAQGRRLTFEQAAAAKHASIVHEFRNKKHRQDWIASLERHAYPVIGQMDVGSIEVAHVLAVLRPIWQEKTETASRVRQRIESVLSWATVAGHRTGENPARWQANLSELLPKPAKVAKTTHYRAMPWEAIPAFMEALAKRPGAGARALELAILCASRSGEVRGMTWDEVDLRQGLWTIPAERMKAGKPHQVPLSDRALTIIKAQPRMQGSPFVFAAPRGGAMSDMTLSAVCRRMEVDAVPHGFRSSFKDWARHRTNYRDEISELALAHVSSDATRAAYARSDLLPQRAKLLQDWAKFCSEPFVDTGAVIGMRRRSA